MHSMPGDISKSEKIFLLEKGRDARAKSFRKMLKMRERATLKREAENKIREQVDGTD